MLKHNPNPKTWNPTSNTPNVMKGKLVQYSTQSDKEQHTMINTVF